MINLINIFQSVLSNVFIFWYGIIIVNILPKEFSKVVRRRLYNNKELVCVLIFSVIIILFLIWNADISFALDNVTDPKNPITKNVNNGSWYYVVMVSKGLYIFVGGLGVMSAIYGIWYCIKG